MKDFLRLSLATMLLALSGPGAAIEPDEVNDYSDVFRISAQAMSRDLVEVSWDIEPDYFLYHNKFLRFSTDTPGVELGGPIVPEGKKVFDPLLGEEVIKFRGRLSVSVPLANVEPGVATVTLKVRSQGCLENVLCYPPNIQLVTVELPQGGVAGEPSVLGDLLGGAAPAGSLSGQDEALQPEDAFTYEAIGLSAETILVRFTAQPGYYLYVDKFAFRVADDPGFVVRDVKLPAGTIKDDPEFGPVPVIFGQVEIPVRVNRPAGPAQELALEADYQGCRDGDICYPPQTTRVTLQMPGSPVAVNLPVREGAEARAEPPVSEQDRLARLLLDNPPMAILAFFVAGLLLAFTPCVFPMVPILSGIIAGQGESLTTARAFWLSLVYVLAMAVTYTVAGVLAGLFGQNLQAVFQNPWIISGFVLIFVLLALSMFGFYELQLPGRWQTALAERSNRQRGGQFGGVAVMGFLSALIVGPCVAPPLAAALIVIGASGSAPLGGAALFALSLGMGVPLILFGVSAGKLMPRAGAWMDAVKAVFGVGLLALGVWMLERILPGNVIMLLWGVLAVGAGMFLKPFGSGASGAPAWHTLFRTLGFLLLLVGTIEIMGALSGGDRWTRPLEHLRTGGAHVEHVEFRRIKSVEDLDRAVEQAVASGKPAMLDFYADWCVECIRMERNTFPDPGVQALLEQLQPLQADVTANDEIDQAL
ncbi:MAG: protein-disulfide reductase DsbD, partial [Xanthomonadales bacterium]|nr:protein-disulfide reductase DsbD [Xanthomonadales bacterium]NIX13610.1 protein-disulfide reductase DsbD [Xanthomonadales bacterium]